MKGFYHRIHGGRFHDQVLMQVERYVEVRDWKLLNVDGFKDRYECPCEPDILFSKQDKKNGRELYVVEVETKATRRSIKTKWNQYKRSTAGITDLIIIDLSKLKEQHDWMAIDRFIDDRMPG